MGDCGPIFLMDGGILEYYSQMIRIHELEMKARGEKKMEGYRVVRNKRGIGRDIRFAEIQMLVPFTWGEQEVPAIKINRSDLLTFNQEEPKIQQVEPQIIFTNYTYIKFSVTWEKGLYD